MRLEDYWDIGPKTRTLLVKKLGTERAIAAIQSYRVQSYLRRYFLEAKSKTSSLECFS